MENESARFYSDAFGEYFKDSFGKKIRPDEDGSYTALTFKIYDKKETEIFNAKLKEIEEEENPVEKLQKSKVFEKLLDEVTDKYFQLMEENIKTNNYSKLDNSIFVKIHKKCLCCFSKSYETISSDIVMESVRVICEKDVEFSIDIRLKKKD